jgi:hypothetical protein
VAEHKVAGSFRILARSRSPKKLSARSLRVSVSVHRLARFTPA